MDTDIELDEFNETHHGFHKNGEELTEEDFCTIVEWIEWYAVKDIQGYSYNDETHYLDVWYM